MGKPDFVSVFNDAYNIYTDDSEPAPVRYRNLEAFLAAQVSAGNIGPGDKSCLLADVISTAEL